MYQSSEAFGNLVLQDSRTFKALITYDDVSITNAKSIKFTGGAEGEDDFSLGSTVSQYVTITIPDPGKAIEGHELLVQIGMEVNGLVEYIPMGYFTPGKPSRNEEQIEFTAYDRMMKTERAFSMDGDSTDTAAVLKRIQEITGVMVVTDGLSGISMKVPKGYSCREVLSYAAQLHGRFAVCNRNGQIELHSYVDSGYTVSTGRYWDSFEHNDYLFQVEKLTCYTGLDEEGKDVSVSSGDGPRAVIFSNPFMTQDTLDKVMDSLKGFSYMPGSLRMMGDPRLDPWDVLTVEDRKGGSYKVPLMKLEREYDGGFTDSVEAVGLSEDETNANWKGPATKEMERYYAQLVMIDHAMINKLDVDTANLKFATIQNLNAVNATVQNLDAEFGSFRDLTATNFTAANAKINILDSSYANIKTLLAGGAGVGDLQNIHLTSQNAVIDSALIRTAVMQTVTVGDLLSGTISTNKFMITSDDGGIKIQGATQQWRDTDGTVRMQAGRDANGDFTFSLFDKTGKGILLDATGVKEGAIADGLIVNKMVADNAAIAGTKLDIPSVVSAINGSSQSIKSSRIWFDDQNQSLNQLYSQMNTNIVSASTTASNAASTANAASNTANAASDAAKKAMDTLSGISTLDAIGASLDNDAHVVHTYTDGSGGDYSSCHTTFSVYLGDTDVSDRIDQITVKASEGVNGTWNPKTRTYQVTAMTSDNSYVDISGLYGLEGKVLLVGGKGLVVGGKTLVVKSMGSWITKRFSISKAKDGKIGLSYDLRVSSQVIRKQKDGKTLVPESVTFSAFKNDNGIISSYSGIFQIEESKDNGKTYVLKYGSSSAEIMKIYAPSGADVNMIRCTLYDTSGAQNLDTQTVMLLADAEGLADDIKAAQNTADQAKAAIVTTNQKVANIETSVDGLKMNLSETTTDLHGLVGNSLLYNVRYHDNEDGTTTVTAVVYQNGSEVTKNYPAAWFSWRKKTESGESFLGYGYSIKVKNEDYMFGGVVIGRFTTYKTAALIVGGKLLVLGGKAVNLNVDAV
nr:hypothetical protein [uncultured Blautia sp.]DAN99295.1 MAG TPA: Minor structural protein 4 [Caudoviricetes sp.]